MVKHILYQRIFQSVQQSEVRIHYTTALTEVIRLLRLSLIAKDVVWSFIISGYFNE